MMSYTKDYDKNQRMRNFIDEIIEVCKKYGLSLSHEDAAEGAFEVCEYFERASEKLKEAFWDVDSDG